MINKQLCAEIKHNKRQFLATVFFSGLGAVATVFECWAVARIVNGVFFEHQTLYEVAMWFGAAFLSLLCKWLVGWLATVFSGQLARSVKERVRRLYIEALFSKSINDIQGESSGKLLNLFFEGVDGFDAYYRRYLPQLAKALLIPLVYLIFIFPKDQLSALLMLVTLPLIPFFMVLVGKWTEYGTRRQWFLLSSLSAYLLDVLRGLETLKILGRSKALGEKIEGISEAHRITTLKVQRWAFLSSLTLELLSTISIALIAVGLGLRLVHGEIPYLEAFFILLIAPEFYQPMRDLGTFFHVGMNADAAAGDIFAFLGDDVDKKTAETSVPGQFSSLRFEHVSYTYPGQTEPAVKDASFEWNAGTHLAIVGRSGSGKTTLLRLALGQLTPDSGCIYLNDRPLSQGTDSWNHMIGLVPQTPGLISGSLADNIVLGDGFKYEEQVRKAFQESGLAALWPSKGDPFYDQVGSGAISLSGGQKALLSFARILVQNPSVLFMDEPTENLDMESEVQTLRTMKKILANKSSLTIAHRLPTVQHADKVLIMEKGSIREQGSYAYLSKESSRFRALLKGDHYE